ncbi:MAG: efflux RND transporter periplasmic adaptor subunit [Deinococcales bacterium]
MAAVAAAGGSFVVVRDRAGSAPAQSIVTATVKRAAFQVKVDGPGSLSPIRSVSLTPPVSGTLIAIASVGDRVVEGASLARLDPTPFQRAVADARLSLDKARASLAALQADQAKTAASLASQVASARAAVDAAQRDHDSQQQTLDLTRTLFDMGSASANELQAAKDALSTADEARANARTNLDTLLETQRLQQTSDEQALANARIAVEQAKLTFATAEQDLADTEVVAPFDGIVSAANGAVGESTGGSDGLLTFVDDATVVLDAQIDETDIGRVAVGQSGTVTLDAIPGTTFPGRVTRIAPTATLVSNIPVFYVAVEIDNADHALRAGMTGQASLVVRQVPDAFQLPARAVHSANAGSSILVEQTDGSYRPVPVTVVAASGINSVLTGDVPDGAVVLVSGDAGASPAQGTGPGGETNQRRPNAVPFPGPGGGFRRPRQAGAPSERRP